MTREEKPPNKELDEWQGSIATFRKNLSLKKKSQNKVRKDDGSRRGFRAGAQSIGNKTKNSRGKIYFDFRGDEYNVMILVLEQ